MSEKKRTSISIDKDVYEYLRQEQINQSGLINQLVREYQTSNDRQVAALELRYEHLKDDVAQLRERLERKESQLSDVKELLEEARHAESELWQDCFDIFEGIRIEELEPDNPAVENWCGKFNMEPKEFLTELEKRLEQ